MEQASCLHTPATPRRNSKTRHVLIVACALLAVGGASTARGEDKPASAPAAAPASPASPAIPAVPASVTGPASAPPTATAAPAAAAAARAAVIAKCPRGAFRVVVDVGHTLGKPGAESARGIDEYAFNLQLAQDIKAALLDAGFDKTVLLVTAAAPPHGLFERAQRANGMAADLFLAIHHDSVPDNLMQTWQYEGNEKHFNDDYPGYALFISNDNGDRAGSLLFGQLLGKALQAGGLHYTPHYTLPLMGHHRRELVDAGAGVYRYDQLIVLRNTRMPAVLLEAGSIVNRNEELELGTKERRAATSAAVVAAVEDFCAARAQAKLERLVKQPAAPAAVGPKAAAH